MEHTSKLRTFVKELSGLATTAETTLGQIGKDPESDQKAFLVFSEQMIAIRGTADQLGLSEIAKIAGLGEEIAIKGSKTASRSQARKCMSALWDALTTLKYMLEHFEEQTSEEQRILELRLEGVLRALGGARPSLNEAEIEALLQKLNPS